MKKKSFKLGMLAMALVFAFVVVGCGSLSPERMVDGFRGKMDEKKLDPTKAYVDFSPGTVSMLSPMYWGLLFIRKIDNQAVKYDGYGDRECSFYLEPGKHTISSVRWQNQAVVGNNIQGSSWVDNLQITYDFEAGKYYKLWAESFQFDTGKEGLFGPVYEERFRLVVSRLN